LPRGDVIWTESLGNCQMQDIEIESTTVSNTSTGSFFNMDTEFCLC